MIPPNRQAPDPRPRRTSVAVTVAILAGLCLALGASGCAGYRVGPTNGVEAKAQSVQVSPFSNQTLEPRLGEAVTISLRKILQQDGTYRLETRSDGDVVVSGRIVRFDRGHLSFQPGDILTPRDYRLVITAQVTAQERLTGKVLLHRNVSGQTTVRAGNDLNSAERQGIPLAAEDLARNATALLVDGTW